MSFFTKWYIRQLQNSPMRTNMCSAVVVMSAGDIMAQQIEKEDEQEEENDPVVRLKRHLSNRPGVPLQRQVSFRRYGTLSPDVDRRQRENRLLRHEPDDEWEGTDEIISLSQLQEIVRTLIANAGEQLETFDMFRTATMVFWAAAMYTPFYVFIYKVFDKVLPKGVTPMAVSSRVIASFALSVPTNAAFFCYGSGVHHVTEWVALLQERHYQRPGSTWQELIEAVPLDLDMATSTAMLKLKAELWNTVKASACVWVPFNSFNFSVVPPHLRPLGLMVFSAFWNCYLSLAQHRSEELDD